MAKGDKKKVDTAITAAQTQSNTARLGLGNTAQAGYTNATTQGAGTRKLAEDTLSDSRNQYNSFLSTGPSVDYTNAQNKLNASYGTAQGLHNDTFDEFAQTGGFSPTDAANFRARGNSPISAAYSNARDEMMRGNSLQGGYGGNFAAAQSQLARQGGAAAAQAGLNTEASLAEQIRAGRMGGAQGQAGLQTAGLGYQASMAGAMGNLALGQDQNRLAAMSGLTGVGNSLTNLYGTSDPALGYLNAMLNNQTGQAGANAMGGNKGKGFDWMSALGSGASAASSLLGNNKNNIGPSGNGYTGGFEYPNGGNVYNSNGWDANGNWQDPWGGWGGGDVNNWENYWDNPNEGRVTGSGFGS
jgi:hypothetical protein